MADDDPLAGLLDRAGNVFSLAGELGRAFQEEKQTQGRNGQVDPHGWDRHKPSVEVFYAALLELRDAMQSPPANFGPVAQSLKDAARIARAIRDVMKQPGGRNWASYLDFFPDLNSVAQDGGEEVARLGRGDEDDDPLSFVDDQDAAKLPALPEECVTFLESVRDELHLAAEAKRNQFARGYGNDTIKSMISGVKWDEARSMLGGLCFLPSLTAPIDAILKRRLTIGTVEQLDELLPPAVRKLRDALESVVAIEPPELIELKAWFSKDGIKGFWGNAIASAECWRLTVDVRHRNIAFLIGRVFGEPTDDEIRDLTARGMDRLTAIAMLQMRGDPSEGTIRDYLFQRHGIMPSDEVNLEKLEQLLRLDAEAARTGNKSDDTSKNDLKPKGNAAELADGNGSTQAAVRLLAVFTNGLADARFASAAVVLNDEKLSTNEKLTKIDAIIPFPATVSAEQLGQLLGVSKQAVLKTVWWSEKRKGEKASEIGRRDRLHKGRAKQAESASREDNDDR